MNTHHTQSFSMDDRDDRHADSLKQRLDFISDPKTRASYASSLNDIRKANSSPRVINAVIEKLRAAYRPGEKEVSEVHRIKVMMDMLRKEYDAASRIRVQDEHAMQAEQSRDNDAEAQWKDDIHEKNEHNRLSKRGRRGLIRL